MSHTPAISPSSADRETIEYRAVSGWAIAALVLGMLSAAAIFGPLLWFIPALGMLAAIIALRRIRAADGELTGRNLAILGLLLAVLFGIAAPARAITRRHWLAQRAEAFTGRFLELLEEGHGHAAHQLTVHPLQRKPLTSALPASYANDPESQRAYEGFAAREPAHALLAHGAGATVELLKIEVLPSDERGDSAVVRYRIDFKEGGITRNINVALIVERPAPRGGRDEQWQIVAMNAEPAGEV